MCAIRQEYCVMGRRARLVTSHAKFTESMEDRFGWWQPSYVDLCAQKCFLLNKDSLCIRFCGSALRERGITMKSHFTCTLASFSLAIVHTQQRSTRWHEATPVYHSALYLWTLGALAHSAIRQFREEVLACCHFIWPLSQKWSPHLTHVSFWDSEARISRQNVSIHLRIPPDSLLLTDTLRYGLQASPFPTLLACCHLTARSNRTFFFSCKDKKRFEFAWQASKRLTEKAVAPGALLCELFWLCTINTPFRVTRSVAHLPGKKGYSLGLTCNSQKFKEIPMGQ